MTDDLSYTCPHCWQEHKTFAGMTFGEVLALQHNHEHLRLKAELLQLQNGALQEENARLRAALKPFADAANAGVFSPFWVSNSAVRAAAAAIQEGGRNA